MPKDEIKIRIYSIIHTSADSDRGDFPTPSVEGSYLSLPQAQEMLKKMVSEVKEHRDFHCSPENYKEEYGDNYWEAYEDGYGFAP